MQGFSEALYAISTALLLPVMVGILALLLASLALLGGIAREFPARLRWRRERQRLLAEQRQGGRSLRQLRSSLRFFPRQNILDAAPESHEILVGALEEDCRRSLAFTSFGGRGGPALGLMGTLIPLGPALVGLSQGDLQTLSSRLVVAFTTTVVGLLVGFLCFGVGQVRSRWFADDLLWLDTFCFSQATDKEECHEA